YMSYKLGDPTPKIRGRLTMNPLAHLDLMGSLVLIITRRFGWAKPVPINPTYYNNPRQGMMYVGLAGPGANIVLAIIFSLVARSYMTLAGASIYTSSGLARTLIQFLMLAVIINLSLAVFNLLPVPPLDGSKILRGFLPSRFDRYFMTLEGPMGMILLLVLAYTGILWMIISPVVNLLMNLLL
ncbi:MAG: site-2 protease family protein, partial [Bacillota bacterium]